MLLPAFSCLLQPRWFTCLSTVPRLPLSPLPFAGASTLLTFLLLGSQVTLKTLNSMGNYKGAFYLMTQPHLSLLAHSFVSPTLAAMTMARLPGCPVASPNTASQFLSFFVFLLVVYIGALLASVLDLLSLSPSALLL